MGGLFGGGGSQPQQVAPASFSQGGNPAAYQPMAQPAADVQFQNLLNSTFNPAQSSLYNLTQATSGPGAAGWAYPYAQNAAYNIGANPYAQEGINAAQYLAENFAPLYSSYGPNLLRSGQGLLDAAPQLLQAGSQELGLAPQLISAGFDPQAALYNQLQNQTSQAANAANAASGVGGPYAASTTDEALRNFNMGWQNQQLQRELAGSQGAAQALGAGAGLFGQAGNLTSQGANIIGAAGPIEQAALAMKTAPGQLYGAQQSAALNALAPAVNIGEQTFNEANSVLANLANYLNLGRQASLASGQLGNLGFNQGAQSAQGLGGLAGLGSNFLFGNQGLSGALGLGSGGLIGTAGDLFGGAADFSGGAAAADAGSFFLPGTSTAIDAGAAGGLLDLGFLF